MLKILQNVKIIAFLLALMPTPTFSMDAELPEEVMHSVAAINAIKIPSYQELEKNKALFLETESLLAKASVLGIKKRIEDALSEEESKLEHLSPKAKIKIKISILLTIQRIASDRAYDGAYYIAYSEVCKATASELAFNSSYYTTLRAASDEAFNASDASSEAALEAALKAASDEAYYAVSKAASKAVALEKKWLALTAEEHKAVEQYVFLIFLQAVQNFIISNNSWFKDIITKTVGAHLENPPTEGWDEFKLNKKTIYSLFSKIEKGVDGKDISPYFTPYRTTWDQLFRNNKKAATILLGIQNRWTGKQKAILNLDMRVKIAKMVMDSDEEKM